MITRETLNKRTDSVRNGLEALFAIGKYLGARGGSLLFRKGFEEGYFAGLRDAAEIQKRI